MTKKLFVVLVVVAAMLLAVSWAIAAKKAVVGYPDKVEMPKFTDQQGATAVPKGVMVEKADAVLIKGTKQSAAYTAAGPLTGQFNRPGGKDFCDLYGSAAFAITDWFYGMEWYANYQDPEEFGCVAVWPFQVVDVGFNIMVDYAQDIDVQGFVYSADFTVPDCPVPGIELCATPVYTFSVPDAGHWALGMPMVDECCVYEPYFAVIYIVTDLYGTGADAVAEDNLPCDCRSYNDYGAGWDDLCVIYGWPGPMMLWSDGYTSPQNDCPGEEEDTCFVTSVDPPVVEVLAGGTANFSASVVCQGEQTECLLTVTPDPACPSCVTTITPNPVPCPGAGAISIVTDPSTPPGDYVFDVNGSKASATVRVLEVSDECELKRDNGSAASYFGSWDIGDQNATYMDPEEICVGCGPDVYPFKINKVKAYVYDHAGAGTVDVTVHFYAVGVLCDGPGAAFYSYGPVTVTTFYPDGWTEIVLPDEPCVEGPFFLALEYNTGIVEEIPSVLFDNNAPVDTCYQWNYRAGGWIEWWDFWATPADVGWLMIRADGICGALCPKECYLIQDEGVVASYFSGLGPGDILAKYFDPELYCEDPVYPLNVHDVDMLFYDFAGVGTVDIRVNVYMVCHDTCDGPGTHIYRSDPITITTFYPDMAHIVLEDVVCVNEPFYIGIEWVTGEPGSTPSQLMQGDDLPCDSCHAWMYYPTGGADFWIEWYDFWSPPPPGCPILRVSAATNHPDCEQAACDDPLEMLWGGLYAYYYWKQPEDGSFINMMFQTPLTNPGRLDAFEVAYYAGEGQGTPDADIYVWLSDGSFPLDNNPPYQALASFQIPNDQLVYYPTYAYVDCHELGLYFDPGEKFHIGCNHAHEAGDTLRYLSDDGAFESERGSAWDGGWFSYYPYEFLINAYLCLFEAPESTFTVECSPFLASATPGDPPADKFDVDIGAILGYNLNVTLGSAPPAGINVSFVPPNGIPPFTSDVMVSVDLGVAYGDYTVTLCGTGDDGQVACCDVKVRVEPPFDEAEVPFYHGMQRASNFGAVGNDVRDNFVWYGISALFDGSFIVATDSPDNMALDAYNCVHWNWLPSQHIDCYYDAEYNANICYGNFYTPDTIISCEHDSVFIVGIMDECIDFSIKIKVYYNPTEDDPIYGMYMSLFEDWDVGDAYNNAGNLDPDHNIAYMYDPLDPDIVFGMMKAPFYDDPLYNAYIIPNYAYVWPCAGFCDMSDTDPQFYCLDSLYWLMTQPGNFYQTGPDSDFSILQTSGPIDLLPGEKHIEVWIDFGRNLQDGMSWSQWWHRVLRYAGFYRGDVNASDTLELPALDVSDLVYLIQYLFMDGPAPLPYLDQGDVDGTCCGFRSDEVMCGSCVNVGDVIYLLNYVFLAGPPPVDYMRFIPQCWPRESLFENHNWD